MTSQQSETKTKPKRNQLGTVTCTNRPDLWKVREAMAHAAEEMFGCKIKAVHPWEDGIQQ